MELKPLPVGPMTPFKFALWLKESGAVSFGTRCWLARPANGPVYACKRIK